MLLIALVLCFNWFNEVQARALGHGFDFVGFRAGLGWTRLALTSDVQLGLSISVKCDCSLFLDCSFHIDPSLISKCQDFHCLRIEDIQDCDEGSHAIPPSALSGDLITRACFMQKFNLKSASAPVLYHSAQSPREDINMYGLIFENFSGYIKVLFIWFTDK